MAGAGVEIEDEIGDHRPGEIPHRSMFGPQRRQALPQRRGDIGNAERLPAVGPARHVSRHEDGHRPAGQGGAEGRQADPGREPDVGPVGPHPQRSPPFVDDARRRKRQLPAEGRATGRVEHDPFAPLAAVRQLGRTSMADDPVNDVGVADHPRRDRALETLLDPAGSGRGAREHRGQQDADAEHGRQGRLQQGHGEGSARRGPRGATGACSRCAVRGSRPARPPKPPAPPGGRLGPTPGQDAQSHQSVPAPAPRPVALPTWRASRG